MSSTHFSASISATVTTSTSFELASSHARVTSIKSAKQELVSQSVGVEERGKGTKRVDSNQGGRGYARRAFAEMFGLG